ncbi:polysaccharide pyruvyl transferase family protein, partial [Sporolactobacillus vineae]|uniref:polysaccharide pyruvyl transferase family protein n=1 Tax=Sporolactobacillus vineae TaxID=444463 RepID=UPI00028803C9
MYTIFLNKMNINHNKSVQAIKEADIVVSCGGGFFQSINIKYFLSNFIYHLIQMKTAIQFNKDLVLYAQSIGAFSKSKFILFHVKEVLNAAKLILVREGLSYKNVEELLDDTEKLHITGDIAFLLEKSKSEKYHILDKNRYHIGITIRNWNFPNKSNVELLKSKYKKSIIDLIEYLTSQRNISVYLLPQVIGPGQDNDRIIHST